MFKHKTLKVLLVLVMLVLVSTSALAAGVPKYVFYFIGDGMGASQRQAAEYYLRTETGNDDLKLTMNILPVAGMNTTHSADSLVTDSAAAGTALATGYKTNNQMISQLPDGTNVKTILEAAKEKGMAAGVVTSSRLTHATPATFVSHVESRYMPDEIANQYLASGVEYFAGGGYRYFIPGKGLSYKGQTLKSKREDNKNLINGFADKGYNTFLSSADTESFRNYKPNGKEKVFAAFTYSHTPYELDRKNTDFTPSLAEMTKKGIEVLSKYENGFFMMVEGARIDHACHANDPAGTIHDTIAFDKALKEAYEFYKANPKETLIVVAADHETGGFGLGFGKNYFLKMDELVDVKVTTADVLNYGKGKYDGDRAKFFKFIEENLSLEDLTKQELTKIEEAMEIVDNKKNVEANRYGGYDPVAIEVTHILSTRVNMNWTTYAHSGTAVPMSAIGVGATEVGGFKDNTEVAQAMFKLLGVQLTSLEYDVSMAN